MLTTPSRGTKFKSRFCKLVLFSGMLLCSGCEVLVEGVADILVDCLDNDRPQFVSGISADPVLNQVYSETLTVEIRNEPYDDSFTYEFTRIGDLPAGLTGTSNGRRYTIEGTAYELGTYRFTLRVNVSNDYDQGLCSTVDEETYQITVQET